LKRKKILITGFPHSGTSILKSKLGECPNLYECVYEESFVKEEHIAKEQGKEYILTKTPILPIDIRAGGIHFTRVPESRYYEYIIILVVRNPWNVFTSLIKDGKDPLNKFEVNQSQDYHIRLSEWLVASQFFLNAKQSKLEDVYTIKYEDFFTNNFENLYRLMDSIGLQYSENIFSEKTKNYIHAPGVNYDNIDPNDVSYAKNRLELRTWQINQPFQNMNGEVNIPEELNKLLTESDIVQELGYTDPRLTH